MSATTSNQQTFVVRVPNPLAYESPSSWLSRVALIQGAPMDEVLSFLRLRSTSDIDISVALIGTSALEQRMGIDLSNLEVAIRILKNIIKIDPTGSKFLLQDEGPGQFRYCVGCFKEQQTSHVPIHWRVTTWRHCPLHDCLMDTGCPHCGTATQLPADLIRSGPRKRGVAYLKHCVRCDKPLTSLRSCPLPVEGPGSLAAIDWCILQNGRATLAALYAGHVILGHERKRQGLHGLLTLYNKGLLPRSQHWLDPKVVRTRTSKDSAVLELDP